MNLTDHHDILDFFEEIDFEEIEIEDGMTALFIEIDEDSDYGLITDTEGNTPGNLAKPIVFACYNAEGAFQWSSTFKTATEFKELWSEQASLQEKFEAVRKFRKDAE